MNPIDTLTALFERFPGIGPRQARRFVQYLLAEQPSARTTLSDAIRYLGSQTSQCRRCFRWFVSSESGLNSKKTDQCSICASSQRDATMLFVVEKDADIENVERSGFRGLYFVLGGTIPLAAEEPEKHIRMRELLHRVEADAAALTLTELILGLSATTEGDHTRQILQEKMRPVSEALNFKISSLGRGLSTGSELEYADPDTIQNALNSRN